MNTEQKLLEKWRKLPLDKQQQALQFVESLNSLAGKGSEASASPTLNEQQQSKETKLGHRLRQIRTKIVASGEPLLNREEIEQEVISRRGGLQNISE